MKRTFFHFDLENWNGDLVKCQFSKSSFSNSSQIDFSYASSKNCLEKASIQSENHFGKKASFEIADPATIGPLRHCKICCCSNFMTFEAHDSWVGNGKKPFLMWFDSWQHECKMHEFTLCHERPSFFDEAVPYLRIIFWTHSAASKMPIASSQRFYFSKVTNANHHLLANVIGIY